MSALLTIALALVAAPAVAAPPCDRACLTAHAERYMEALVAHRPEGVRWAGQVRFAENGVPMQIGDGLWGSITAKGANPLIATDPQTGTVAWMGSVEEHGQPGFYAMRLTVDGDGVAVVESVVRRKQVGAPFGDPATFAYDPAFAEHAAPAVPRARLQSAADGWLNALSAPGKAAPSIDPACTRSENGLPAAPLGVAGCADQLRQRLFGGTDRVRRRIAVVDSAQGVVVAIGFTDHGARVQRFTATDGRPYTAPAVYPHAQAFAAAFKIGPGGIRRIAEVKAETGYAMPLPFGE